MGNDVIGGFRIADPICSGCRKPLTIENAWMTDGCPCNSALGINSMNETRWRLLMQLQQRQSAELQQAREEAETNKDLYFGEVGKVYDLAQQLAQSHKDNSKLILDVVKLRDCVIVASQKTEDVQARLDEAVGLLKEARDFCDSDRLCAAIAAFQERLGSS